MVEQFPATEIWTLENLEGYQLWQLFQKINLQGRNKLIVLSMSAKVITIEWSHFQSASNKPLKFVYFGRVGYFNWLPFG